MFADFTLQMRQRLEALVRQMDEFLSDLLLEIKFRVKLLQRSDRFLESLRLARVTSPGPMKHLRIQLPDGTAELFHLLAQARQHLHVALAALDFVVEDHAIEPLAAVGYSLGEIAVRLGNTAKPSDEALHHDLRFLDPLRTLDLLL